jgi:2-methylaconitate cis-trans-isomerase PrpF
MDPTKAELEREIVSARRRLNADVDQIFQRVDQARDRLHDVRRNMRNVAWALGATAVGIGLVIAVTRLARGPRRR